MNPRASPSPASSPSPKSSSTAPSRVVSPADVCDVVKQRGQFSFVRGGQIPAINKGTSYRTAIAVAKVALADAWNSPAEKALYFNTADRRPAGRVIKVASIGNHVFYR
nr:cell wall hydrolase [Sphingomonas sp. Ant20]